MPKAKKCAACGAKIDTDYADTCWHCGKNYEASRKVEKASRPSRPSRSATRREALAVARLQDEIDYLNLQSRCLFCIFSLPRIHEGAVGGLVFISQDPPGYLPLNGTYIATKFPYLRGTDSGEAAEKAAKKCRDLLLGGGKVEEAVKIEEAHMKEYYAFLENEAKLGLK